MATTITTVIIGVIICVLAAMNMRGNISTLHSYHRNRVRPEDVLPFGKLVGLGTLIIGITVIIFSILNFVGITFAMPICTIVGTILLFIGLIAGLIISFYAMKKYNGGMF